MVKNPPRVPLSGFTIVSSVIEEARVANEPWLGDLAAAFTALGNNGGKMQVTTADTSGLEIGDSIWIQAATPPPSNLTAPILSIDSATQFTLDTINGPTKIGVYVRLQTLELPSTDDLLITYQASMSVSTNVKVEITFDDGATYRPLNNNQDLDGYFTFTFLAPRESKINFRSPTPVTITAIIGV